MYIVKPKDAIAHTASVGEVGIRDACKPACCGGLDVERQRELTTLY